MRHFLRTLFCLTAVVVGCSGRSTPIPVIVGHVATLSGSDKEAGEQAAHGLRLAVKEINRDGGQGLGRPVGVLHTDTAGRLEAFEAEAVRLIAINRVVALLGGTTAQEVERLDRDRVPLVTFTGLRTRGLSDLVFCAGLAPSFQGRVLARFATRRLKASGPAHAAALLSAAGALPAAALALTLAPATIVVLEDERHEEFGQVAEAFLRELPAASTRQVRQRYGKDADFGKHARQAVAEGPALVLIAGDGAAVRQLQGHLPPGLALLFGGSELQVRALQAPPHPSQPLYAVVSFVTDKPGAEEFVRQYRTAFSEEPDPSAALAYEAAGLLFEALRQADGVWTPARLREQLVLVHYQGLFGQLSFQGQIVRRPAFLVRLEHGHATTLEVSVPESGR